MKEAKEIVQFFRIPGEILNFETLNSGHINTTSKVSVVDNGKMFFYTVQAINTNVFKNPEGVMSNILKVTSHIKGKIEAAGGDVDRGVLTVIMAKDDKPFYFDEEGTFWRVYRYIDKCHTQNKVEDPKTLYNAGFGFGNFQNQLADFPKEELVETIVDFHNTPVRYQQLLDAIKNNPKDRVKECTEEIKFFENRLNELGRLTNLEKEGKLPLRVTHNDTKFNNILIDDGTNEALSVIDLDTVMPGLVTSDFGDAIRFATNTAAEDETDLSKVGISLELYDAFARGFLKALDGKLTEDEMDNLAWGAKIMTMECGMRFLADHINGDVYFKIHREGHNLDRARNQIALAKSMEENFDKMQEIIKKYK